jgi:hypothetical protein
MRPVNLPRIKKSLLLSAILLAVFLLFLPAVQYRLVYDDIPQIEYNPRLTAWSYVPGYFTTSLWAHDPRLAHSYFRPIFLLWLRLSDAILGAPRPIWHLPSILAHIAVTLCVFLLLRLLVRSFKAATLGAALFAIHPIQTESVAWISASGDLLLAIFLILSVYFYAVRKAQIGWASLAFAALAMFTKEPGIVAPALIFAYEWIHSRFRIAAINVVPYFAPVFLYLAFRGSALGGLAAMTDPNMTLGAMLLTWPHLLASYALHLAWPAHLSPCYNIPAGTALWPFLLLIAVIPAVAWLAARGAKTIQFGAAWFAITLAPALALRYATLNDYLHDRYLYLPSVGLAMMAAAGFARIRFTPLRSVAACIVALALCYGTYRTLPIWSNNISLFQRAQETAPENPSVINNLAYAYLDAHREADAYPLLKQLIERYPGSALANYNMARYYQQTGDPAQANYYFSISDRLFGKVVR